MDLLLMLSLDCYLCIQDLKVYNIYSSIYLSQIQWTYVDAAAVKSEIIVYHIQRALIGTVTTWTKMTLKMTPRT